MGKILIFLLALMMIGAASGLPLFGPPQGFRNNGAVELGSLTIGGESIDSGDVAYLGEIADDVAANATKADNALAWLALNDTRIDNLVVPLASFPYSASSVDQGVFTASGGWVLTAVKMTPRMAGTDGSAVTVMVKICDSGEAPTSGDNMLSGALDLKGTADTPQSGAVSAGTIATGKIVALDFTGTLTNASGIITLYGTRA
jgi:hypothetical protein